MRQEDYSDMEEVADRAINNLREFIDTEKQFITKEHELHEKLYNMDAIYGHLMENMPQKYLYLHELNHKVWEEIQSIELFIQEHKLEGVGFVKEDKENLKILEKNIEARNWQAAIVEIDKKTKKVKKVTRVEQETIKELHGKIVKVMIWLKGQNLKKALEHDVADKKLKKEYKKKEEYYFAEIYKFLRAYERILRHIWKKENMLSRKKSIK